MISMKRCTYVRVYHQQNCSWFQHVVDHLQAPPRDLLFWPRSLPEFYNHSEFPVQRLLNLFPQEVEFSARRQEFQQTLRLLSFQSAWLLQKWKAHFCGYGMAVRNYRIVTRNPISYGSPGPKTTSAFFRQLQRFCFSSQIFHFLTSKVNHNDRNGHITCNFFHCQAMISSFTKVMGLQSRKILEKTEVENCFDTKDIVVGIKMHSA